IVAINRGRVLGMRRCLWLMVLVCGVVAVGCSKDSAKHAKTASVESGPTLVAATNTVRTRPSDAAGNSKSNSSEGSVQDHEKLPTEKIVSAAEPAPTEEVLLGTADLTRGIPGKGPLKNDEIRKWLDNPKNMTPLKPTLPMGLSMGSGQIAGLDKNPLTR